MAEPRRISQTLIKPLASSHARSPSEALHGQRVTPRPTAFAPARPAAAVMRQPIAPSPSLGAMGPAPAIGSAARAAPGREPRQEGPVLASIRIDINGAIVAIQGNAESLAPLVGYVTRMGALLALQLGLEPFEALSADLGTQRALIFSEGDEMVGLLLGPGALHQELRQQLGV